MAQVQMKIANNRWTQKSVRELVFNPQRGISYTSKDIESNDGVPMINLACIDKAGYYREGELKYFSGAFKEDNKVYPNDLVVACTDLTRDALIIGTPFKVPGGSSYYLMSSDMAFLALLPF